MKLQQATRYALCAVVDLASRPNQQVRAQELAERYELSQNHMVRVLHALTKAKIVKSARGPGGGFTFCANANRLTVYDIICLFETGWPNEESTGDEQNNPVAGELGRVLHEVDRITWATLRSVTIQTIIKNAERLAALRLKPDGHGERPAHGDTKPADT